MATLTLKVYYDSELLLGAEFGAFLAKIATTELVPLNKRCAFMATRPAQVFLPCKSRSIALGLTPIIA